MNKDVSDVVSDKEKMVERLRNWVTAVYIIDLFHENEPSETKLKEYNVLMSGFNRDEKYRGFWRKKEETLDRLKELFEEETEKADELKKSKLTRKEFQEYVRGYKLRKSEMRNLFLSIEYELKDLTS
jgi:tRNA-dihydrouridine synthase